MTLSAEARLRIDTLTGELIAAGGQLGARQYHEALAGNISARVSAEDLVLCSRHGADVGALTPDDLLLVNLDGEMVEGKGRPTSEIGMHCRAYAMRPEILSVVHAHPPTAMAFAATSTPLDQLQLPEMLVLLGQECWCLTRRRGAMRWCSGWHSSYPTTMPSSSRTTAPCRWDDRCARPL